MYVSRETTPVHNSPQSLNRAQPPDRSANLSPESLAGADKSTLSDSPLRAYGTFEDPQSELMSVNHADSDSVSTVISKMKQEFHGLTYCKFPLPTEEKIWGKIQDGAGNEYLVEKNLRYLSLAQQDHVPEKVNGDCSELACAHRKRVERRKSLSGWNLANAFGRCPTYFSGGATHVFNVAWEGKVPDCQERLSQASIEDRQKIPEGTLLCDPTFGVVLTADDANQAGYKLAGWQTPKEDPIGIALEPSEQRKLSNIYLLAKIDGDLDRSVVLGYAKDIVPKSHIQGTNIISLRFQKSGRSQEVDPFVTELDKNGSQKELRMSPDDESLDPLRSVLERARNEANSPFNLLFPPERMKHNQCIFGYTSNSNLTARVS